MSKFWVSFCELRCITPQKWKSETRLKTEQIECSTYMLTHLFAAGNCIFYSKIENWIECSHRGTQLRVHLFRKLLWSNPVGIFSKSVCQTITKLGLLVRSSIFLFVQPCMISKKEYGVRNAPRSYETFMLHVLAT